MTRTSCNFKRLRKPILILFKHLPTNRSFVGAKQRGQSIPFFSLSLCLDCCAVVWKLSLYSLVHFTSSSPRATRAHLSPLTLVVHPRQVLLECKTNFTPGIRTQKLLLSNQKFFGIFIASLTPVSVCFSVLSLGLSVRPGTRPRGLASTSRSSLLSCKSARTVFFLTMRKEPDIQCEHHFIVGE